MYKNISKVLCGVFGLLLATNLAYGIDAEFKNTLMKIDLIKTSESNYNVDLYTKNKFIEPVKVIKKSDLNYYILLPETKNESLRNTTSGIDIRSLSTNVYPYAGSDVNNGYVKININTTKPINFKVNIKNSQQATKTATLEKEIIAQEVKKEVSKETSLEKKNFDSSISKKTKQLVENKLNLKDQQ